MSDYDYLPIGGYGKLPFYGDYLQRNVRHASSRALRDWIDKGRDTAIESALPDNVEEQYEDTRPRFQELEHRRFLFAASGAMELLAGVIRPSSDGVRMFPFALFTHLPKRLFGRHYPLLPFALTPVWEALDDAWNALHDVPGKQTFEELLDSTRVPGPTPLAEARRQYETLLEESLDQLADRVDGVDLDQFGDRLPAVLGGVRKATPTARVRLELPVSEELERSCFDTAFWIDLIDRQFRWHRTEPSVFVDGNPTEPSRLVLIIYGGPATADYVDVMHPQILAPDGSRRACSSIDGPPQRPAHGEAARSSDRRDASTYGALRKTRFG